MVAINVYLIYGVGGGSGRQSDGGDENLVWGFWGDDLCLFDGRCGMGNLEEQ